MSPSSGSDPLPAVKSLPIAFQSTDTYAINPTEIWSASQKQPEEERERERGGGGGVVRGGVQDENKERYLSIKTVNLTAPLWPIKT